MTFDDSIGYGLLLSVAFWAAAIGGFTALAVWALVANGWISRNLGRYRVRSVMDTPGSAATVAAPAEEGAQLNEWEPDRLGKVA